MVCVPIEFTERGIVISDTLLFLNASSPIEVQVEARFTEVFPSGTRIKMEPLELYKHPSYEEKFPEPLDPTSMAVSDGQLSKAFVLTAAVPPFNVMLVNPLFANASEPMFTTFFKSMDCKLVHP